MELTGWAYLIENIKGGGNVLYILTLFLFDEPVVKRMFIHWHFFVFLWTCSGENREQRSTSWSQDSVLHKSLNLWPFYFYASALKKLRWKSCSNFSPLIKIKNKYLIQILTVILTPYTNPSMTKAVVLVWVFRMTRIFSFGKYSSLSKRLYDTNQGVTRGKANWPLANASLTHFLLITVGWPTRCPPAC